jgi:hypothetical protein
MNEPGPLFPYSWTSSFGVARGQDEVRHVEGSPPLQLRPEYKGQGSAILDDMIKTASPVFDKTTEDGVRFCIYRLGVLEVRTTQETSGAEVIGAVFSVLNQASAAAMTATRAVQDEEKISVVTEFVEREFAIGVDPSILRRRLYVVFETDRGSKILTERMKDGSFAWVENPRDLEDRNSLAKVTRSEKVETGVLVRDMKAHKVKLAEGARLSGKRYAQAIFVRAAGPRRNNQPIPAYKEYMNVLLSLQSKQKKEDNQEHRTKVMPLPGNMLRPAARAPFFPK